MLHLATVRYLCRVQAVTGAVCITPSLQRHCQPKIKWQQLCHIWLIYLTHLACLPLRHLLSYPIVVDRNLIMQHEKIEMWNKYV